MKRIGRAGTCLVAAALLAACGEPGTFRPRGEQARAIASLWWLMLGLGTAVFVLVIVVFARAARGRRQTDPARLRRWVILGGVVLPVVVLVPLSVAMFVVADRTSHRAGDVDLEIDVVGHQFWWEVRYPRLGVITANEIHIPVGHDVRLRLTTADVIHSVWVPELSGKIDMIPGKTTELRFDARESGEYKGYCAEFCGIQHARMRLLVIAQRPTAFARWAEEQARDARGAVTAAEERGAVTFEAVGCASCHSVRGTDARGDLGPDLTHVASRRTLGAGTVLNRRGQLAGWIVDPQAVKPGNLMPPTPLTAAQLDDLLSYLERLE